MLSMWTRRLSLGFVVALAVWAPRAMAQAVYGGIAGTVTDSSGAAVPETRLTLTSLERKTVDTAISNASGFYLKDRLLPGAYAVTAERAGFKEVHVPSVMVYLDTQTQVDLALYPGPVTETVTVEAQGQLLKTDRADVATTLGAQEIEDLPNLDRNFTRFVLLSPGAIQLPWQHAASENPHRKRRGTVGPRSSRPGPRNARPRGPGAAPFIEARCLCGDSVQFEPGPDSLRPGAMACDEHWESGNALRLAPERQK